MWGKINKFVDHHVVLAAFLLGILFMAVLLPMGMVVLQLPPNMGVTVFTACQLALSLATVLLMKKLHIFERSDFKFKNMGKGLLLGWVFIAMALVNFVLTLMRVPEEAVVTPHPLMLLIVVLHPFIGTGLFEEVLFRGLILKLLHKKMGQTKKGMSYVCILSSVIFGVAHFVNLIHADALPVVSQVIYATATGILFAALYLRTKTLWVPILLHGLVNLSSQIFNAFIDFDMLPQSYEVPTDVVSLIINTVLIVTPCVIAGFVLLKKAETAPAE